MMSKEVQVEDYCGWDSGKYGVFLNGVQCYEPEKVDESRTYEFRLFLQLESDNWGSERPRREDLTFFATVNLSNYVEERTLDWGEIGIGSSKEVEVFNIVRYDKIVKEFAKEEFEYLSNRLLRFDELNPRDPVVYEEEYLNGGEFFEFTEETAPSWGGPVKCKGMKGCVGFVKEKESEIATMKPINIQQDWRYWRLPQSFRNERKDLTDSLIYHMSGEEREKLFLTFPVAIQFAIAKETLKNWSEQNFIWLQEKLPFRLMLCGNDDTSYSKYFATKEKLEEELNYLRAMQPLDIVLDVYQRGYEFTN